MDVGKFTDRQKEERETVMLHLLTFSLIHSDINVFTAHTPLSPPDAEPAAGSFSEVQH